MSAQDKSTAFKYADDKRVKELYEIALKIKAEAEPLYQKRRELMNSLYNDGFRFWELPESLHFPDEKGKIQKVMKIKLNWNPESPKLTAVGFAPMHQVEFQMNPPKAPKGGSDD